jgi:hypothetical protein
MTSRRTLIQEAFDQQVDAWTANAVRTGLSTFAELLAQLPGVYPSAALQALDRIQRDARIDASRVALFRRDAETSRAAPARAPDFLPLPHPLDFEWRFTPDSAEHVLTTAQALTRPGQSIVFFGTPRVAVEAITKTIDRPMTFIGEDNPVTNAIIAMNQLHGGPLTVRVIKATAGMLPNAGVVVVDPPWYFDFIRPMLAAATSACRDGGHVLMSLLPEGTRPGARHDRDRLIAYARRLGLHPARVEVNGLAYDMPFFESNALGAAGVRGVPPQWRRADLLVLEKSGGTSASAMVAPRVKPWREISVGRMRLFIAETSVPAPLASTPLVGSVLARIVPGDVLPTVSRRDSRRRRARVWTSGNRIFHSPRPDLVVAAALHAAENAMASIHERHFSNSERDEVTRLSYDVLTLAAKEEAEEHNRAPEDASCVNLISRSELTSLSITSPTTVSG